GATGQESGRGVALFTAQGCADFRKGGFHGSLADGDEIVGTGKVIPNEWLDVWFDDDIGLLAPGDVTVALDDIERPADDVRYGAGIFQVSRFQINRDDDVRAEQQCAFHRNGRSEKAINESASFKLDGHEEPRVGAGAAQRWSD